MNLTIPATPSSSAPGQLIFDHQRPAFDKLAAVAKVCISIQRETLPIRPRTNSLIIGPTGSGKTFLAKAVADELGVALLSISVSEWILLGCNKRGASTTCPVIVRFLLKNKEAPGVLIFVDEIDKVGGQSSWEAFLRTEIFQLLDLNIPGSLNDDEERAYTDEETAKAREVLSNRTFLLAAGAFQHL